jgi:hypothetical protein
MSRRFVSAALAGVLILLASVPDAVGYIHFPPMTLQKMCKQSHHIRLLKIEKASKEKGVIIFEVAESAKGGKSPITSFKHVIPADAQASKPILDWMEEGKTAVMFSIESESKMGCGYVFIDEYCYCVDYNAKEKYWLVSRGEPNMSACYHGSVEELQKLIKDTLDGKEVKLLVKEPESKEDRDKRYKEVNDVLIKNRR